MRVLVAVLALVIAGEAMACSCLRQPDDVDQALRTAFRNADAVVLATAQSVRKESAGHPLGDEAGSVEHDITEFRATTRWKGENLATFQTEIVTSCCLCGMAFKAGRTYLLYLSGPNADGRFSTSICTRSTLRENAGDDIAILNKIASPHAFVARDKHVPQGIWSTLGRWLATLLHT